MQTFPINFTIFKFNLLFKHIAGLVRAYLVLSKIKEALYVAREAMKAIPQSAKALKLVGDVHASSTTGREKVRSLIVGFLVGSSSFGLCLLKKIIIR